MRCRELLFLDLHPKGADGWLLTEVLAMTQTFAFSSIPVKIALVDIYRGVEFPENATG